MNKTIHTTTFIGKLCGLLLMLLFATPALASSAKDGDKVVSGVVIDKKTKEPMIGVNVAIWKDGEIAVGTSTDFDGAFHLALASPSPTLR